MKPLLNGCLAAPAEQTHTLAETALRIHAVHVVNLCFAETGCLLDLLFVYYGISSAWTLRSFLLIQLYSL